MASEALREMESIRAEVALVWTIVLAIFSTLVSFWLFKILIRIMSLLALWRFFKHRIRYQFWNWGKKKIINKKGDKET